MSVGNRQQDVWLSAILATVLGTLYALILVKFVSLFPGKTVVEFLENIGSKVISKIIGAILVLFALTVTGITIRDFAELMVTAFYPKTPLIVFIITLGFLITWSAYAGIEVIARMGEFLLGLTVLGIIISGLLAFKIEGLSNFFPLVENGVYPIIRGGITQGAFFGDLTIWLLLLPHLNQQSKGNTFMPLSVLLTGGLLVMILVFIISGLGIGLAVNQNYPFLSLVRMVSLAGFIEGVEFMFLIIWVTSNFMKAAVYFYTGVFGLKQILKINNHAMLVLVPIIFSTALSVLLFNNYQQLRYFYSPEIYGVFAVVIHIGIPAVVAFRYYIKARTCMAS